eukprot:CAMPEP_0197445986 /NCGR_PEP_ID=MMETSP1175-20131217/11063_1 /TAXON_ID=1003142 /ORGANISM="Triceratium dubium, Strain CCMP147" /LENGTH=85 /DNA_ID=CAMNT_0042977039 /DNA_START=49 /DNA_END=306 /DNA_ORIENTATION=-
MNESRQAAEGGKKQSGGGGGGASSCRRERDVDDLESDGESDDYDGSDGGDDVEQEDDAYDRRIRVRGPDCGGVPPGGRRVEWVKG